MSNLPDKMFDRILRRHAWYWRAQGALFALMLAMVVLMVTHAV